MLVFWSVVNVSVVVVVSEVEWFVVFDGFAAAPAVDLFAALLACLPEFA